MNEKFIDLTDGTRLEVKMNFGTLYWLAKADKGGFFAKTKKHKSMKYDEMMSACGSIVYAVLRSNGKKVTFDEALELMPMDIEAVENLLSDFGDKVDNYKKKEQSSAYMRNQGIQKKH